MLEPRRIRVQNHVRERMMTLAETDRPNENANKSKNAIIREITEGGCTLMLCDYTPGGFPQEAAMS